MSRILIDAPAKLNLNLHIKGKRADGFHDIESLFLALVFGDTLCLETIGSPSSLEISMDWQPGGLASGGKPPELPPECNIISRAVSLFRNCTGYDRGLKIMVTKRIPLGGGMGGGSSNAAATLLALNRLALSGSGSDKCGLLSDETIAGMGADLGSDVPFFLHCRTSPAAWVTGRGECVQPVVLPDTVFNLSFVLVNPGFPSNTAEAFRQLDIHREKNPKGTDCSLKETNYSLSPMMSAPPAHWQFTNDFLPVLSAGSGIFEDILSTLKNLGADFSWLSGSGSTCFGIFSDYKKAVLAKVLLLKRFPYVFETFPLRVTQSSGTMYMKD